MHPDAYTVSLPYPTARPCRADLRLAQRLFPMYTGCSGELAAISGYLYAALRTEECQPELGKVFDDLARTEMHHFRLLGRLLRDLGADPFIRARIDSCRLTTEPPTACAWKAGQTPKPPWAPTAAGSKRFSPSAPWKIRS